QPSTSTTHLRTVRGCLLRRKFWHTSFLPLTFTLTGSLRGEAQQIRIYFPQLGVVPSVLTPP
ncbi:MAG: hypothetical protein J6B23_08100, partial [Clostridia bacterium]|nr:hypothetical protein [Clostridia bacterium]